eukprot:1563159-Rhodomonas_salina.2
MQRWRERASERESAMSASNMRLRSNAGKKDDAPLLEKIGSETETETETDADGYDADDHPQRRTSVESPTMSPELQRKRGEGGSKLNKVDPHVNFENLQHTSKWFPNAYKPPEETEETPEV